MPVAVDAYEDDDGFLGEIVGPATPVRDAMFEPVPDELDPEGPPEDLLGALVETQDASHDDLDDILDDMVSPAASALESGAGERSAVVPDEGMRDASEAFAPAETNAPAGSTVATPSADHQPTDKPASVSKPHKLTGRLLPRLSGTREISRRAYAGGLAVIVLLTCVSVGQAAIILARPVSAGGQSQHVSSPVAVPAVLPINYATVDLERFVDKTRALSEGGRQMLRNPVVKEAIVGLDSGEQLYQQIEALAASSDEADRASIRNNRVRITSCNAADCGDRAFQLTYDIQRKSAVACITEKYLNGAYVAYRYGPDGYQEVPHCGG